MDAIQKTAIKETAKVVGAITGLVIVVSVVISLLSLGAIAGIVMVYCLFMGVKMIYDANLAQAKADAYTKQAEIDAEIDRLHK
jgi:hypothetical protein